MMIQSRLFSRVSEQGCPAPEVYEMNAHGIELFVVVVVVLYMILYEIKAN